MIFAVGLLIGLPQIDPASFNCWAAYGYQTPGSTQGGLAGEARIAVVTAERAAFTDQPVAAKPGAKRYVVRGNEVVIGAAQGGFVPAIYPQSGTVGCLPVSALRILPASPVPRLADWRGEWNMTRGKLAMKGLVIVVHGDRLTITGDATVQHGVKDNYNFGEFEGGGKPSGASLMTEVDGACRTRFQLLGRYLVVTDVMTGDGDDCPNYGFGVGFSGVYTRSGG